MTKEHEEAAQMLVRKFGRTLRFNNGLEYSFTPSQLAALVAEVRRQAIEEAAEICRELYIRSGVYGCLDCSDTIRARLEEGKA